MSRMPAAPPASPQPVDSPAETGADEAHFLYLLFQASRQRDLRMEAALAPLGVSLARWRTLAVIRRTQPCTMGELAFFAGADRTTLTRSIDQLVRLGLVERWSPPRDRRKVHLALSAAGLTLHAEATTLLEAETERLLAAVGPAQRAAAQGVLEAIIAAACDSKPGSQALIAFMRAEGQAVPTAGPRTQV